MQSVERSGVRPPDDLRASAENRLWQRLRHHQLGVAFRKRQVAGSERTDFFCPEAALVVCIDEDELGRVRQEREDERLRRFGLETLRFSEQEILFNTDRVVVDIFRSALSRTANKQRNRAQ